MKLIFNATASAVIEPNGTDATNDVIGDPSALVNQDRVTVLCIAGTNATDYLITILIYLNIGGPLKFTMLMKVRSLS